MHDAVQHVAHGEIENNIKQDYYTNMQRLNLQSCAC